MTASHDTVVAACKRAPFRTSLLILVGLLLVAAGVLGYIALGNEADYRALTRDPVRVEADMIDGGPSGRFGYEVKYRFRVDNLINTGRIHVSEADWQWISASKKVPVVYARDNPRLFDTNPEVYRDAARKYAYYAAAFFGAALLALVAARFGRQIPDARTHREGAPQTSRGISKLGFLIVACLLLYSANNNYTDHRALHADMRSAEGEIIRTWTEGKNGGDTGIRYRFGERMAEFYGSTRNLGHWKPGDRVTVYFSESRPTHSTLDPDAFRRTSILHALGSVIAFIILGVAFLIERSQRGRLTATPASQETGGGVR